MIFERNVLIKPLIFINAMAFLSTSSIVIFNRVSSDTLLSKRSKGLEVLANHVLAKTCWVSHSSQSYKIGDLVKTEGTLDGRIPTSCVYSPKTQQFLEVGYLEGELQVINIFSKQELKNKISQIKEDEDESQN